MTGEALAGIDDSGSDHSVISAEPIRGLRLEGKPWWGARPDDDPDIRLLIAIPGLHAVAEFPWWYVAWRSVADFFREIDRDWRGWHGAKEFGSTDGPFYIAAFHDGRGHVRLSLGFADAVSKEQAHYRVEATFYLEVGGAQVTAIQVDDWISEIWGADSPMAPD